MLIRNATIATSTAVFKGDVLVIESKIAAIGEGLSAAGIRAAEDDPGEIIDAEGLYLLPGGVDVHTHMDLDVGFTRSSDTFLTGTIAAACGGTTTIIDHMAFGPAGASLHHQVEVYEKLAEDAVIDYGFHGVIQHVDDGVLAEMDELAKRGITSFKIYLTYDFKLSDAAIQRVLTKALERGYMICVHCEDDGMLTSLRQQYLLEGFATPRYHALSRPSECELLAVQRMLALSRRVGDAPLYVVHLSTELGLEAIRAAKARGQQRVFAETCPQYLLLDDSRYDDPSEGLKYIMSPPLRKLNDEEALWCSLAAGEIDTIATDHCPFFFAAQKQRGKDDFTLCPGGASGVEERMPLIFSHGFMKGRLTLPQLVWLCCTRPAQLFGLGDSKGDIKVGMDADLVLFDANREFSFTKEHLHENVDYTPYEGLPQQGYPILTISRGEVIVEEGSFTGNRGRGRYLNRRRIT